MRSHTIRRLAVAALLLYAAIVPAAANQTSIRFERLTVEDGLSQSSVNCIAQDRAGFMWFGTQDGLNRFDGYEFRTLRNDPDDPTSISHNFIWDLHVDAQGVLWIATAGGGLNALDPATGTIRHYRADADDPNSLPSDKVLSLDAGENGDLWIGTDSGLARMSRDAKGTIRRYLHDDDDPQSLAADRVRVVFVDRDGDLWVGTDGGGLSRLAADGDRFEHFAHDPKDPGSLSNNRIRTIVQDDGGQLWVGTYQGGVNVVRPATGEIRRIRSGDKLALANDRVRALLTDIDGSLWIGTDGGLNHFSSDVPVMPVYRHDPADPHSLGNNRILSLFQDRGGVVWVATQAGLSRWNPAASSFSHIRQAPDGVSGIAGNVVNAVLKDPAGRVWVGTYGGGVSVLDREAAHSEQLPSGEGGLSDDRVMSLARSRSGAVWIGTFDGGVDRYDPATKTFRNFSHDPDDPHTLGSNGVTSIVETRDGELWAGCYRGGLNLIEENGRVTRQLHRDGDPTSLSDDRVMSIHEDRGGTLWVGTDGGGLNRFDRRTGVFERVGDLVENGLRGDVVWSILESRDGSLWVGTQGGGLHRWAASDRREGKEVFTHYDERDGLPNAFVYGILEDDEGRLWLSTNRGLSRFDPVEQSFLNFGPANGLQSYEFNFGAYHRADDGEMFFGGNNGLNAFYPTRLRRNDFVPPVRLTAVYGVEGPFELPVPVVALSHLTLGHRDRVISFEFAALDFTAPRRNRYAYKLDGFDRGWVELGTSRRATYTNLPPGRYTLQLRGSNSDGVWNEAGTSVALRVLPPPWLSWWAWTVYVALVGAALLWAIRAYRARMRRKEEYSRELEVQVRERTRELAEANAQLNEMSLTDSLTGLRNRRYALTCVRDEMAGILRDHLAVQRGTAHSTPTREALFLMIDLDGFKQVNDLHGHEAGDRVLLGVRDTLTEVCRSSDTVVRWGGDEFLVVCRNTHRQGAVVFAEKVRRAVAALDIRLEGGERAEIGCSIGFAFYPFVPRHPDRIDWERVQIAADAAMYVAKRSGKNRWVGILHDGVSPPLGRLDEPHLTLPRELAEIEGMTLVRSEVDETVLA